MDARAKLCFSAVIALCGMFMVGSLPAFAGVPDSINYQGILSTSGGSPVPDGSYSVTFSIYHVSSGPTPAIWTETKSVATVGGTFSTLLGSVTALPPSVFSAPQRFLGITVSPDPEMMPRTPIVAVPYAYRIATIDGAAGGSISGNFDLEQSTATSGNILKYGAPFLHNFGIDNTFAGISAGNLTMSGRDNTATGFNALHYNTTGASNTATGDRALLNNTTGGYNTATGDRALMNNTTGVDNTAIGYQALASDTSGALNTACGWAALTTNTSGSENTACGYGSLFFNTTGHDNTAGGTTALRSNATGDWNTAFGKDALYNNTAGSYNTALGSFADVSVGNLTNATAIGNGAIVNASNKIRLGNGAVTVIEGQVAYTFPSDSTQKENFRPVNGDEVLRKIRGLNLRSWNYIGNDPQQFRHYGPMAQEFFAAFGHDGVGTSGTPTTINSGDEAGILMIAIQTLEKRTQEVEAIKTENRNLQAQIAELREMIRAQASNQK